MPNARRAQRPPRRIALMRNSTAGGDVPLDFMLSDFQDALAAYARMSDTAVPDMAIFEGDDTAPSHPVDTMILSIYAYTAVEARDSLRSLCSSPRIADALTGEQRVYGIACIASSEDSFAPLSREFESLTRQMGLTWCGMLGIGNADALADYVGHPRLGFWRRPVSEALDRFIGAVRSGLPISESQQLAGAVIDVDDTITVRARRIPHRRQSASAGVDVFRTP